ncbi:hypothetical protein [Falsirhodobacter sp. alg1]|uniref:hypothetical protein n=1 Tax=Falsirhodobacter sp. alg1 TaxID=1472418 RepID=UPI000833DF20|nr:hypothetical protein [Falsirhodobacter sp. alg1]
MKRGWCPSTLRPMQSGDGLIVRLRPVAGRLSADQAQAVADMALRFGNGRMDLSSRAGLQIRGVSAATHPPLVRALQNAGLAVDSPPVLSAPFTTDPLETRINGLPALPSKFGIVLDRGEARVMAHVSGDIRLERGIDGSTIIRADGRPLGRSVTDAVAAVHDMAEWFVATGGAGRMAAHDVPLPDHLTGNIAPVHAVTPALGMHTHGALVGLPFGELDAPTLRALGTVVLTPWRALFLPGVAIPPVDGLILREDDPLRRVVACPGAPACSQGLQATRPLARRLAAQGMGVLHISGCAKGCARPHDPAPTLVGMADGFGLIPFGLAADPPQRTGLYPPTRPEDDNAASL